MHDWLVMMMYSTYPMCSWAWHTGLSSLNRVCKQCVYYRNIGNTSVHNTTTEKLHRTLVCISGTLTTMWSLFMSTNIKHTIVCRWHSKHSVRFLFVHTGIVIPHNVTSIVYLHKSPTHSCWQRQYVSSHTRKERKRGSVLGEEGSID